MADAIKGGTMNGAGLIERLRLRVKQELLKCDGAATPKVCAETSTPEGYLAVERMVIAIVAQEGCAVGTAVFNLESELP